MPKPLCFDGCYFVVRFEISKYDFDFVFSKIVLAFQDPLKFYVKFRMDFPSVGHCEK